MIVAIYARYSTDLQKDTSIEDQVRRCKQYAITKGLSVQEFKIYGDRAISGALGASHRTQYAELLEAIRSREINVLISDEQSRLTRSERDFLELRDLLTATGVRLLTADGVDSFDSSFNLITSIQSAVNAKSREETAFRVLRGMQGTAERGGIFRAMPFGYKRVVELKGSEAVAKWVIDDEQAEHVRFVFEQRSKGHTYVSIAKALNSRQIPAPRGGLWNVGAIGRMLSNKVYTGRLTLGDGTGAQYKQVSALKEVGAHLPGSTLPELQPSIDIYVPDLAIIGEHDYNITSPSRDIVSRSGRGGGKHWSNGLVQHKCGRVMSARDSNHKTVTLSCSKCVGDRALGLEVPPGLYLNQLTLQYFLTSVLSILLTEERIEEFRAKLLTYKDKGQGGRASELEAKLRALEASEARIVDTITYIGGSGLESLQKQLKQLASDRATISRELAREESGKSSITPDQLKKQLEVDPIKLLPLLFENAPACELRSFLAQIFPLIEFEGRSADNQKYSYFRVQFAPGVLTSLTSKTSVIVEDVQEYRFEVMSSSRRISPPSVTLLDSSGNSVISTNENKHCPRCKEDKPVVEFSYANKSKGTRAGHCKKCINAYHRERRKRLSK